MDAASLVSPEPTTKAVHGDGPFELHDTDNAANPSLQLSQGVPETLPMRERNRDQVTYYSAESVKAASCFVDESKSDASSGHSECPLFENSSTASKSVGGKAAPDSSETGFVMEACVWPDLAEARNVKGSSMRKGLEAGSKGCVDKGSTRATNIQKTGSPTTRRAKPISLHDFVSLNQAMESNVSSESTPRVDQRRSFHSYGEGNSTKWRNNSNLRRGNFGSWHHGKGGFGSNSSFQLYEQRVGPRNMHHPEVPAYPGFNPAFYGVPNFDYGNVPGVYLMPVPLPEYVNLMNSYYGPPVPPGGSIPNLTSIQVELLKQIEYYFSVENLCRDWFLRSNMDEQGYVNIEVIANFNRIKKLMSSIPVILAALQKSTIIEIQGVKIRRREDWAKWVYSSSTRKKIQEQHNIINHIQAQEVIDLGYMQQGRDGLEDNDAPCTVPYLLVEGRKQYSHDRGRNSEESATSCAAKAGSKYYEGDDCVVSVLETMCLSPCIEQQVSEPSFTSVRVPSQKCSLECWTDTKGLGKENSLRIGLGSPEMEKGSLPCDAKCQASVGGLFFDNSPKATAIDPLTRPSKDARYWNTMSLSSTMREVSYQIGKDHRPSNTTEESTMNVNDEDVQRLIVVNHAQLGPFIAVP